MKSSLFTPKFIIPSLLIASIYIIFVVYLMNGQLVTNTVIGDFPLDYKIKLLVDLLGGIWTAMTFVGLTLLILTGLLTGANLTLIIQRFAAIKSTGGMHLVVGGSSLIGIVGSGCAACGLPILAFLGLSGSIVYLPLRGTELAYLAVILLFISLYFMVSKENNIQSCNLTLVKPNYEAKKFRYQ